MVKFQQRYQKSHSNFANSLSELMLLPLWSPRFFGEKHHHFWGEPKQLNTNELNDLSNSL